MNNKVTLQDLADQLSAISGQSKKLSEGFLRALTEIVEDALAKDGIAKVKGIGTFKIVAIEERKSVSVTDGSAVIIPAHKKITFTPEKELKEAVNKPFEDLETYVLPSDGPVDGPYEEDDDDTEETTTQPEETEIPVEVETTQPYTNIVEEPSSSNVTGHIQETIQEKKEEITEAYTKTSPQYVSTQNPIAETTTPTYTSTPETNIPVVEKVVENINTENIAEKVEQTINANTISDQPSAQQTVTPPVSEPVSAPIPEKPIYSESPTSTATQPQTETCAPVGHTPNEEIRQTEEHIEQPVQTQAQGTAQQPVQAQAQETAQQPVQAPTQGTVQQPVQAQAQETAQQPVQENTFHATDTVADTPAAEAQTEAKAESVQDVPPTDNTEAGTEKKEEKSAPDTNEAAAQPAATEQKTSDNDDSKGKHHKKHKKEKNRNLLIVIIILTLLIIACLFYALRGNKGFNNQMNEIKWKITNLFVNKPTAENLDNTKKKDTVPVIKQEDEFFEEKTEDMYEAAQADQEFPMEVEQEQNWDWFEEGVKKFIKKEYPKINFEVKGEPVLDTIHRGQTLTSMSRKHYNGVKDFWVYIYLYNKDVIRRPDDVAVGTAIKIPQLDETVIDPSSYESINAAKDVKESYLRLFN
ncbi:MAG: HU family DNA-binding protein [Paludibacteraceae bacterium]|nr:HU family DNA-binding protein [Paludibacteraceae bacterium]